MKDVKGAKQSYQEPILKSYHTENIAVLRSMRLQHIDEAIWEDHYAIVDPHHHEDKVKDYNRHEFDPFSIGI
jgi:hypothetical protein